MVEDEIKKEETSTPEEILEKIDEPEEVSEEIEESGEESEGIDEPEEASEEIEESGEKSEESDESEEVVEEENIEESVEESIEEQQEEFGDEIILEESGEKEEESESQSESESEEEAETEEEGEELLDEELLEDETEKKSYKGLILKILAGLGIALVVVYLAMCIVFSQVFYYGTMIDGKVYSWKQVEDVEDYQEDIVEDYELTIIQITGEETILTSEMAGIEYKEGTEIQGILESQNPFLWPTMLWDDFTYETTIQVEYELESVEEAVSDLDFMEVWKMVAPTDAYPDIVGDAYGAIPQEYGTELDSECVTSSVIEAMTCLVPTMNLLETGCYVEADITTESPSLLALIDNLNHYATATITYKEGFVCDVTTISKWLIINEDNTVSLDEEKIAEYVAGLAEQYDTVGTTRSFTSANGNKVEVSGGSYGWRVDQNAEKALIIESLTAGEPTEREIEYSRRAVTHEGLDWGTSYTEIDLSNQKVYYISEGKVVVEGSIVTGNVSAGHATPQGVYGLTYKTKNAVLRGDKLPDGTYSYESPVAYWMPFNGGIGMHDASWRSSFGGTIYKYSGSHGCVNMSYSTAQAMYSHVSAGDPIICHY